MISKSLSLRHLLKENFPLIKRIKKSQRKVSQLWKKRKSSMRVISTLKTYCFMKSIS